VSCIEGAAIKLLAAFTSRIIAAAAGNDLCSGSISMRPTDNADFLGSLDGLEGVAPETTAQVARRDGHVSWSCGLRMQLEFANLVVCFGVDAADMPASSYSAFDAG
jgi:hypothetical protein